MYRGVRVRQVDKHHITVDMNGYIERELGPKSGARFDVPKRRKKGDELRLLEKEGQDLYRTIIGKFIWCVVNTRADVAVRVSQHASFLGKATVSQAIGVNSIADEISERQIVMHFRKLADIKHPRRLEILSDAAFKRADEPDNKSRGGMILCLGVDKCVSDSVSVLGWSSKKILRINKSATGAETLNASACLDEVDFVYHLAQSFYPTLQYTSVCFTDSYSLTSTQDKYCRDVNPNLIVDVSIIRQKVRSGQCILMHVPGESLPTDGLTKNERKAQQPLIDFLRDYRFGINGVPYEFVDAYAATFIQGEIDGGRIDRNSFSCDQLKNKLDPYVEGFVRPQLLDTQADWWQCSADSLPSSTNPQYFAAVAAWAMVC